MKLPKLDVDLRPTPRSAARLFAWSWAGGFLGATVGTVLAYLLLAAS